MLTDVQLIKVIILRDFNLWSITILIIRIAVLLRESGSMFITNYACGEFSMRLPDMKRTDFPFIHCFERLVLGR